MLSTAGIHHLTAWASDVQAVVDFYGGLLGLRLMKQTIHFEMPDTYHLYFGSRRGNPGVMISFLVKEGMKDGRLGGGQVGVTVFAVPRGSMLYWRSRLKKYGIEFMETRRFGEDYVRFTDNSGLLIDLVERDSAGSHEVVVDDVIPASYAILGLDGVILFSKRPERTAAILEQIIGVVGGYHEEGLVRYLIEGKRGNYIDISTDSIAGGTPGVGVVQQLAFRAKDSKEQARWQDKLEEHGFEAPPVVNMEYYKSMTFREPGGILFQIATDTPGFETDETAGELGSSLQLPDRYEGERAAIIRKLKPFQVRELS